MLPLHYNDGREIEPSKFLETKEELVQKFGYCSALTPSEGTWVDPSGGKRHDDINTGFYVDIAALDRDVEAFLASYKERLKKRFNQREIYITYHDIRVV